jgi:hypothetical protein
MRMRIRISDIAQWCRFAGWLYYLTFIIYHWTTTSLEAQCNYGGGIRWAHRNRYILFTMIRTYWWDISTLCCCVYTLRGYFIALHYVANYILIPCSTMHSTMYLYIQQQYMMSPHLLSNNIKWVGQNDIMRDYAKQRTKNWILLYGNEAKIIFIAWLYARV